VAPFVPKRAPFSPPPCPAIAAVRNPNPRRKRIVVLGRLVISPPLEHVQRTEVYTFVDDSCRKTVRFVPRVVIPIYDNICTITICRLRVIIIKYTPAGSYIDIISIPRSLSSQADKCHHLPSVQQILRITDTCATQKRFHRFVRHAPSSRP
jgi:hypothetical protein